MTFHHLVKGHLQEQTTYLEDALQTSIQTIDFLEDRKKKAVAEMKPLESLRALARLNDRLDYERGEAEWLKVERNNALSCIKYLGT